MTQKSDLLEKIRSHDARVGVVGLGYVGLPVAVTFAEAGYPTLGFDVDASVVEAVEGGRSHIEDVADERVEALVEAGRLEATADFDRLTELDVVVVCVPTPLSKTGDPDISYIISATREIRERLRPGQLVVLESTTYPGTTREVMEEELGRSGLTVGEDYFLAFSPERIDPGNPDWTLANTPKVVAGLEPVSHELATALYGEVIEEVVEVSSPEAAELTKILENTFRAVNIALANEMAVIADRLNIDIWEVIEAASTKPYGFMPFHPGPGLGGHCIPVDPHYLAWKMKTLEYKTRFVELASEINAEMPRYVVSRVVEALNEAKKPLNGSRVLVLGVAYKPNVDDTRESPALDILQLLMDRGGEVRYHDPHVPRVELREGALESVALTAEELEAADAVVVGTDHDAIDFALATRHAPVVVDPRNALAGLEEGEARIYPLTGPARRPGEAEAAGRDDPADASPPRTEPLGSFTG